MEIENILALRGYSLSEREGGCRGRSFDCAILFRQ